MTLSADLLHAALQGLETGIILLDDSARIQLWNRWLETRSAIPAAEATGCRLIDLFPTLAGSRLAAATESALQSGLPALLSPALHGAPLPLCLPGSSDPLQQLIHIVPLKNAGQRQVLIQITDVTANVARERLLRSQTEALRRHMTHDPTSQLLKRQFFDEALATALDGALAKGSDLALLVIDVDGFADFNARHGRAAGDACLAALAGRLRERLAGREAVLGRFGSDELAACLPGCSPDDAFAMGRALCEERRETTGTHPTLSLGIAWECPKTREEANQNAFVSAAEVALFHAKQSGGDQAVYFSLDDGSFRTSR